MKIHLNSTKQILIIFAVLVVLLLGFHVVAFSFIRNTGIEVSTLENNVNSLKAQVEEFSKHKPEDIRDLARAVTGRIISRTNIAGFIQDIETKGRDIGVQVSIRSADVQPRSEDPADYLEMVRVQLETRGSWASTMRFFTYLEHLPYKVSIQRFSVSKNTNDGSKGSEWKGEIELTSLKLK
jgi:Tfp pilus assembly protein PilO